MQIEGDHTAEAPAPGIVAPPRRRKMRKWPFVVGAVLIAMAAAAYYVSERLGPVFRERVIEAIRQRYESDVELKSLDLHLYPRIHATGLGLILRLHGRTDIPPLVTVRKFTIDTDLKDVMSGPRRIRKLRLEGLRITVERGVARPPGSSDSKASAPTFVIDEVIADGTVLEIVPKDKGKEPLLFELSKLTLHSSGLGRPMSFHAKLNNPKPPGLVDTTGQFGPWQSDDPIQTPVSGDYTFRNANLAVFRGISGTLASDGKFSGVLDQIETTGTTDIPNFTLRTSGHPVHLKTEFHAIVDGGDGDTLLQPVNAHFLHSRILAKGGATGKKGVPGKDVALYLTMSGDRLEDLLRLAIKTDKPFMTGIVNLKTKFNLPPGDVDVIDKLALDGQFVVEDARFKNASVQDKIDSLSRRARGEKKTTEPDEEVVSDLQGRFTLKNSVMTFSKLSFGVPGALIRLSGRYGLSDEIMDFHGTLRMQAKLSQTMTGYKSWLLKAADPFFSKGGAGAVLPIKITGSRQNPSFGLELHRRSEPRQ
jgi:AsmA-like C-terminal region